MNPETSEEAPSGPSKPGIRDLVKYSVTFGPNEYDRLPDGMKMQVDSLRDTARRFKEGLLSSTTTLPATPPRPVTPQPPTRSVPGSYDPRTHKLVKGKVRPIDWTPMKDPVWIGKVGGRWIGYEREELKKEAGHLLPDERS